MFFKSFDCKLSELDVCSSERMILEGLAVMSSAALFLDDTRSCCRSILFSSLAQMKGNYLFVFAQMQCACLYSVSTYGAYQDGRGLHVGRT